MKILAMALAILTVSLVGCSKSDNSGLSLEQKTNLYETFVLASQGRKTPYSSLPATEGDKCITSQIEYTDVVVDKEKNTLSATITMPYSKLADFSAWGASAYASPAACEKYKEEYATNLKKNPAEFGKTFSFNLTVDVAKRKLVGGREISSEHK